MFWPCIGYVLAIVLGDILAMFSHDVLAIPSLCVIDELVMRWRHVGDRLAIWG
jgi:hypothetical protein